MGIWRNTRVSGFERLKTEPCIWRALDSSGHVVGLVSSHVDDFFCVVTGIRRLGTMADPNIARVLGPPFSLRLVPQVDLGD